MRACVCTAYSAPILQIRTADKAQYAIRKSKLTKHVNPKSTRSQTYFPYNVRGFFHPSRWIHFCNQVQPHLTQWPRLAPAWNGKQPHPPSFKWPDSRGSCSWRWPIVVIAVSSQTSLCCKASSLGTGSVCGALGNGRQLFENFSCFPGTSFCLRCWMF